MLNADKKVLVFTTPTCAPCKLIKPLLDAAARNDEFAVEYQNANESMRGFQFQSVPFIVLYKDGQVVNTLTGVKDPQESLQKIRAALA